MQKIDDLIYLADNSWKQTKASMPASSGASVTKVTSHYVSWLASREYFSLIWCETSPWSASRPGWKANDGKWRPPSRKSSSFCWGNVAWWRQGREVVFLSLALLPFLLYDCHFDLLLGGDELRACRCRCRSTAALGSTRRWWWYQGKDSDLGRWDDYILYHYDGDQGKMRWFCCPRWSVAMAGRTGSWSSGSRTKSRQ